MAKYLVIGGAGFIGSHLVEALSERGHLVSVLDNFISGRRENLIAALSKIKLVEGDAFDAGKLGSIVTAVDGVFHLASTSSVQFSMENPLLNQRSGELVTLAALEQCRKAGVKRLVFSSSASVYGDAAGCPTDEHLELKPRSVYAVSKVAGEQYCKVFATGFGPDTVSLRYFNVFGPRQRASSPCSGVISNFLDCIQRKIAPVIYGDGRQTRDFISVHDVVHANVLAMDHTEPLKGECFNVATGRSTSILDVWSQLCKIANIWIEPRFADQRPGDIQMSSASVDKIRKQLGFTPRLGFFDVLHDLVKSASRQLPAHDSGLPPLPRK